MTAGQGASVGVETIEVSYGSTAVLKGIDLSIPAGQFVALIGSSGCGKTTLLRTISGFIKPSHGRITAGGADITDQPPEQRGMAMVFQSYALWPHMTAAQNIAYGLKLRGIQRADRDKRVVEILDLLRLTGYGERKVGALSGGQRQRVALGRALAVDPPVLLLDEPLSNLDAKIRIAMRHEIRALQQRIGLTAIHVTHDQEEAMTMADRIVILDQGRIAQDGNPEAVYRRPNSSFVASFLGADNVIEASAHYQGDKIDLKLPGGVTAFLPAERALDGDVVIHFRSGAVRLGAAEEPGLVLHGRVTQASYPGGRFRYEVETASGRLFVDADRRAAAGDNVEISIPADELHVFARPKAGLSVPQGEI